MFNFEYLIGILWTFVQVWVSHKLINVQFEERFDNTFDRIVKILLYFPVIAIGLIFYKNLWVKPWIILLIWAYMLIIYLIFYKGLMISKITFMLMGAVIVSWISLWSVMCARIFQKNNLLIFDVKTKADDIYIITLFLAMILIGIWYQFMKKTILLVQRMILNYAWVYWIFCIFNFFLILPEIYRLAVNGVSLNDFVVCTLSVFNIICLINLLMLYNANHENEEKNKYLSVLESSGRKQAETYRLHYEELAKKNHDQKHQLRLIRKYIENKQIDQAYAYIDDLLDVKKRGLEATNINSGNMIIDMLLREYIDRMTQVGIETNVKVSVPFCILSDSDLCVLLGNLLDNAFEAVRACPIGKRQVYINICCIKKIFMLTIRNSCTEPPIITKFGLKSGKVEAWKHGFGMRNVRDIVEKYDGEFQFNYENEEFCVDVHI